MSLKKLSWILIGGVVLAVLIYAGALVFFTWPIGELSISKSGVFGDSFGLLTSLFSGLAFAGLIITIAMQREELALQRQELNLTREELNGQKQEMQNQNETLNIQRFENTFFSLLNQSNNILYRLSLSPNEIYSNKKSVLNNNHNQIFSGQVNPAQSKKILTEFNSEFGHYFRSLYQLLKFVAINRPGSQISTGFTSEEIHSAPLNAEEKMYATIVRSFLSHEVAQILAINCFCLNSNDPYWKYKLLIERYAFLEHMPFEISGKNNAALLAVIPHYDTKAFGESEFLNAHLTTCLTFQST